MSAHQERQEEVDKLLDKTQLEMHAAVQSGGRSPKPLNGQSSVQQLKSGSDSVQNSGNGTSVSSQCKGKRKEKAEQGPEINRKDLVSKSENGDSGICVLEGKVKAELAKITEKGALVNIEGVEKLVHLMQPDKTERKIDLAGRILLSDVIASTENIDCLSRFVFLGGVLFLANWLQEAHKGKIGDSTSPRESDKSVDELLMALLRALDRLPVNLDALRASCIGKSVNNLRSHKNSEIQKKARSLVDTWKKRVDAEMSNKPVTQNQTIAWSAKLSFSEVCQGGNKHAGSSDAATKISLTQPSIPKNLPIKHSHGDSTVKSSPSPPIVSKLPLNGPSVVAISSKDEQCKVTGMTRSSELQLTSIKEEKSSGSSQSQNNSQSCSSGHAKTSVTSCKDDVKSSTSGSRKTSKSSGGVMRHRRSNNGLHVTGISGKSSPYNRNLASGRTSQSGPSSERPIDLPISDHGNGHRLIVRLPNPGRSPVRSTSGGSVEVPSTLGSRASSPGISEKQEQNDRKIKIRSNASQASVVVGQITESRQSNDTKGAVLMDAEGPMPSTVNEVCKNNDENGKAEDDLKTASSSSANEKEPSHIASKSAKSCDPSFSSINALIDSCVKCSEHDASLSAGDAVGMNLLASVATGEICKSDLISSSTSPIGNSPMQDDHSITTEDKLEFSSLVKHDDINSVSEKQNNTEDILKLEVQTTKNPSNDGKHNLILEEHKSTGDLTDLSMKLESNPGVKAITGGRSMSTSADHLKKDMEVDGANNLQENLNPDMKFCDDGSRDNKLNVRKPLSEKLHSNCALGKFADTDRPAFNIICNSLDNGENKVRGVACKTTPRKEKDNGDIELERAHTVKQGSNISIAPEGHSPGNSAVKPEVFGDTKDRPVSSTSEYVKKLMPRNTNNADNGNPSAPSDNVNKQVSLVSPVFDSSEPHDNGKEQVSPTSPALDNQARLVPCTANKDSLKSETYKTPTTVPGKQEMPHVPISDVEQSAKNETLRSAQADETEPACLPGDSSLEPCSVSSTKHGFDLNEGISSDEANQGDIAVSPQLRSPHAISHSVLPPFTVSLMPGSSHIPVTIAAPAKGPFVSPENLFSSKGKLGWKGSAATSAFRPAEPRKVYEMPLSTSEPPSDTTSGKQIRPALDIDLNVADEQILDDIVSHTFVQEIASQSGSVTIPDTSGRNAVGLDLDLNKLGEIAENGHPFTNSTRETTFLPVKSASGEASISRDFDLNNGPCLDELSVEPASHGQYMKNNGIPFIAPSGLRMNNTDMSNMSPWFLPGNAYPSVTIPSFMSDRGDQAYPIVAPAASQRFLGSTAGSYAGDIYRNQMLSSSPAMAFSPSASFQYASFPFGSNFPLASTSTTGGSMAFVDTSSGGGPGFPASIPSQLVRPTNAVGSAYVRPNMTSLQECSTSSGGGGSECGRKWGRQSLDLNAGPGSIDVEGGRDERLTSSQQFSVAGSHIFAEEQARIYHVGSGGLKRKEPEGGWEAERYTTPYKQPPPWQ